MPSRLITHPGVMAAPMDIFDSEASRGVSRTTSALSVSRSSLKISKSNLRRAVTQPRPAPQVYKTEPSDFRSLVQQLTGTSPSSDSNPILTPKPLNPRLQKIAPPPLRPVFQYPSQPHHQQQQASPLPQHQAQPQPQPQPPTPPIPFNPGPRRYPLTSQRPSNFAVTPLSFSPLPALSPADQIWANIMTPLESPGSAAMRQLTQMMDVSKQGLQPLQAAGMQQGFQQGIQQHHLQQQRLQQQQSLQHPQSLAQSNFSNFPHEFSRFSGASQGTRFSSSGYNPSLNSTLNSTLNPALNSSLSSGTVFNSPAGFSGSVAMASSGYGVFSAVPFSTSAVSAALDNPFSFPDVGDVSGSAFS